MRATRWPIAVPFFTAAAAICWIAGDARAQTAPAADAAVAERVAISEHDVIAKMIAFNERFVIQAYQEAGRRDPKWDADAIAFLTAQARDGVTDGSAVFYQPDGRMPLAERIALGRRARAAGCDDPMLLFHLGQALETAGEAPQAAEVYAQASATAARGTAYLKLFQLLILQADWRTNKYPDDTELRPRYESLLRETMTDRVALPEHRRAVWNVGSPIFSEDDARRLMMTGDAIEGVPDADPWLHGTLMGRVEIQRAWAARGSGYAATVTPEGWKGFAEHLALARKHFERAITADDAHPQPFVQMITVAMAESSGLERPWFDHAIARQCDLSAAFSTYRYSLLPRWGGTHVRMFELGVEAVDGGRFDTRVPATLLDAIEAIEGDTETPLDARQKNRVYPEVARCLDGYIEHNPRPAVQRWARSKRAAWAARLEKWDEAQAQFDALRAAGTTPRADAFAGLNLDPDAVAAQAALFTGPLGDEARAALGDAAKLDALIAKLDPADPAVSWLGDRRATADLAARLAGDAWTAVSLDVATAWRVEAGQWAAEGDALVGKPAEGRLSLVSRFELPERYEVRCTVDNGGKTGQANVGIAWAPKLPVVAMLYRAVSKGYLTRQYNYGEFPATRDAAGAIVLHARVDGGEVSILDADGDAVASHDFGGLPTRKLSFGLPPQVPSDATWRFAKIEIRLLP